MGIQGRTSGDLDTDTKLSESAKPGDLSKSNSAFSVSMMIGPKKLQAVVVKVPGKV